MKKWEYCILVARHTTKASGGRFGRMVLSGGVKHEKGFNGYYFKHQKGDQTLCLIAGQTEEEKFIQVITKDFSEKVPFTKENHFTKNGVILNIYSPEITLTGAIRYGELSSIKYDIMGPFCIFPMECRHGIRSMKHTLKGAVTLNGERIDFTGGTGYIEKDSGRSFPSEYTWIQANDFPKDASVMAAVARIPFLGMHFRGCICIIQYRGKEYRLATYLGAKILRCTSEKILLKQGKYILEIRIKNENSRELAAPKAEK